MKASLSVSATPATFVRSYLTFLTSAGSDRFSTAVIASQRLPNVVEDHLKIREAYGGPDERDVVAQWLEAKITETAALLSIIH